MQINYCYYYYYYYSSVVVKLVADSTKQQISMVHITWLSFVTTHSYVPRSVVSCHYHQKHNEKSLACHIAMCHAWSVVSCHYHQKHNEKSLACPNPLLWTDVARTTDFTVPYLIICPRDASRELVLTTSVSSSPSSVIEVGWIKLLPHSDAMCMQWAWQCSRSVAGYVVIHSSSVNQRWSYSDLAWWNLKPKTLKTMGE